MVNAPGEFLSRLRTGKFKLVHFILAGSLLISFVSFTLAHLITAVYFTEILQENTASLSRVLSGQLKGVVVEKMKAGLQRPGNPEGGLGDSVFGDHGELAVSVLGSETVYRLPEVRAQMPGEGQPAPEKEASLSVVGQTEMTHFYPLAAETECLQCHDRSKAGEILGFLRVRHDLSEIFARKKTDLFFLFLVLSPLPLVMALLLARYATWKISRSTELLHEKIRDANLISDFTRFDLKNVNLGFLELNQILFQLRRFVRKVKTLTVDKKILEFETELLEKFIITSDVVRSWKDHVGRLLLEVNRVTNAYLMFSLFKIDDEIFNLEIFWKNTPSEETKKVIGRLIQERINEQCGHLFSGCIFKMIHNVVDPSADLPSLAEMDITLQTKTLSMDSPRIGGLIGIGVQSLKARDAIRALAIDGILTTLLNVVGSIKAIHKYTRELEHFATRDPLTDLYNQRMFWELLAYEVKRAHRHGYPFSVLFIDCDNFKLVNDNFGHKFGDLFLRKVGTRIRSALREGDILTRYGGDEFGIILPETNEPQAYAVARRIKAEIENLAIETPEGSRAKTTVSLGLATYPEHGATEKELFVVADTMMFRAKKSGKNGIERPGEDDLVQIFGKEQESNHLVIEALEDEDLLIPYFQPIMNLATGGMEIHELLMRISKNGRIIPAAEFVEKAEHLGAMHKFDLVLIRKAFETIRRQNYQGILFINISPKSLVAGRFVAKILELAELYGISPKNVVFEITERETLRNMQLLEVFVADLKACGFRFAVDDFGSGYSSFQYIKCFAIDFLKINGEFILNMPHDPTCQAFVKSIVTLSRELGIHTVAEFVEDEEVLRLVEAVGIDFAQGFHVGRPDAALWAEGGGFAMETAVLPTSVGC